MTGPARDTPYRADIDGLRALAILLVLAFHAFPDALPGGFIGVDVFFVISGYLISTIIFSRLDAGRFSLLDFYARRVRRIFPALVLVLLATLAAGWFLLFSGEYGEFGRHVAAGSTFTSNFVLWEESGYFDGAAITKPLLHLWSLAVEEQFYLAWPLILLSLQKTPGIFPRVACAMGVVSFLIGLYLLQVDAGAAFYLPLGRFWELMAGGVLAGLHLQGARFLARWQNLQAAAGLVLIAASAALLDGQSQFPGWRAGFPVLGAFLVISAGPQAWLNRKVLAHRAAVALGLVSFPLYLWHWPILAFLRLVLGDGMTAAIAWAALAVSLVLAILTFHCVEKPVRHLRQRMAVPILAGAMAVVLYLSVMVVLEGGFADRPINKGPQIDTKAWLEARTTNKLCAALPGDFVHVRETCRTNSAAPRLLLAGDSHAMSLYSAVDAGLVPAPALLVAWHSCPLFLGLDYTPGPGERFRCTEVAEDVLQAVRSNASVQTVVMASYYADADDRPSRYRLGQRTLSHAEAFAAGSDAFVDAVLKAGKRVVFLIDVPHLRLDPRVCRKRLASVSPSDCAYSAQENAERRKSYITMVQALQARHPGMAVHDPTGLFCASAKCRFRDGDHELYVDTHHLGPYGARLVLDDMRQRGVLQY